MSEPLSAKELQLFRDGLAVPDMDEAEYPGGVLPLHEIVRREWAGRCRRLLATLDAELAAAREPGPLATTGLRQLVDEQAEDEGLWFEAQTAPEGYLQQELRRLHAAIEALSGPLPVEGTGYHGDGEFDLHYDPRCSQCITQRDRLRPDPRFDEVYATTEEEPDDDPN